MTIQIAKTIVLTPEANSANKFNLNPNKIIPKRKNLFEIKPIPDLASLTAFGAV